MQLIHARGLSRHFKEEMVDAVRRIDLDVRQGALAAFPGPNVRRSLETFRARPRSRGRSLPSLSPSSA